MCRVTPWLPQCTVSLRSRTHGISPKGKTHNLVSLGGVRASLRKGHTHLSIPNRSPLAIRARSECVEPGRPWCTAPRCSPAWVPAGSRTSSQSLARSPASASEPSSRTQESGLLAATKRSGGSIWPIWPFLALAFLGEPIGTRREKGSRR